MNISAKNKRRYLKPSTNPYYQTIRRGLSLGYRKNVTLTGNWCVRRYNGTRYQTDVLGAADDAAPADGLTVLSYDQACEKAIAWFKQRTLEDAGEIESGPYTVEMAAKDWLNAWKGSEAGKRNSENNVKNWILPTLGSIDVKKLKPEKVQDWLEEIAKKPPLKVQRRMNSAAYSKLPKSRQSKIVFNSDDPETIRKRRDTANRVFNDLSALLTRAYERGKVASKRAWEAVSKFENVGINKNDYLTLEEATLFLQSCAQDFCDLVHAALVTGCRYAELATMKVSAYNKHNHSISFIQRKTGKPKHIFLTESEAEFFNKHVAGKKLNDLIFTQLKVDEKTGEGKSEAWKKSNQQPRMKAALKAAGIERHIRFHDLRHTFASLLAMSGTNMKVISNQLGHSSVRTTEAFYAHLSPDHIANEVRANKPKFV